MLAAMRAEFAARDAKTQRAVTLATLGTTVALVIARQRAIRAAISSMLAVRGATRRRDSSAMRTRREDAGRARAAKEEDEGRATGASARFRGSSGTRDDAGRGRDARGGARGGASDARGNARDAR